MPSTVLLTNHPQLNLQNLLSSHFSKTDELLDE